MSQAHRNGQRWFLMAAAATIVLCCPLAISQVEADESSTMEELDMVPDCKTLLNKIIKEHMKIYSVCVKELRATLKDNFEVADKLNCAVKCVLGKSELIDAEGRVTKDTLQIFMDKRVPVVYQDMGYEISAHCFEEFGPDVDLKDENCGVYGKFTECMQHVVTDLNAACP